MRAPLKTALASWAPSINIIIIIIILLLLYYYYYYYIIIIIIIIIWKRDPRIVAERGRLQE